MRPLGYGQTRYRLPNTKKSNLPSAKFEANSDGTAASCPRSVPKQNHPMLSEEPCAIVEEGVGANELQLRPIPIVLGANKAKANASQSVNQAELTTSHRAIESRWSSTQDLPKRNAFVLGQI